MGSINIPREDLSRHKVRIDADNFCHFSGFQRQLRTNEKVQKKNILYNLIFLIDQLPFRDMYVPPYRDQGSFLGHQ